VSVSGVSHTPRRLRWWGATGLVGLLLVAGCGTAEDGDATAPSASEPTTAATSGERSDPDEAVVLSGTRWIATPTGTGSVSVQYFAMVENVSDLVQEVTVGVEMLADDGTVLGSSQFPFFEAIMPGERLPLRLGGQVAEEPADVVPDVHASELADFKQERYGAITFTGEVVDFRIGENVAEDVVILAEVEVTNTGHEMSSDLVHFYLAAFDEDGALMAVDQGFFRDALEPGETGTAEAEVFWNPEAGDPVRMEVHFVAQPFLGG
jgi:hypothetical protein